ncbi:glucokinase [Roseinatronobacter bogoriensis]|uniref:Glucokinase n=1 Tax=Roseinatronobacter bogoriensis subsp. barguzinensis TaxID=441209 RepID=A0A2K8KD31_9RHOB|nr:MULTISPECIES: glucokinase [Rhodobaca]ATX67334.1 glucokinase [Rhodobaca barguzinensis]MBB4206899.1 glucokinase [Rhodobaca bogoriensis DSM 18756]TDW41642.1 glucokinase [Rhodobaca barguzinensis]TDY74179.1 glucokinase [Rhodobaca bogoriensis DSM 18756]
MTERDSPVLVADVGGTNTRVALARGRTLVAASTERFRNAEFSGLDAVLQAFLDRHRNRPERAAIALAGRVQGTQAEMTNLGWQVDAGAMAKATGIGHIALLNDLQAQGHALAHLPDTHLRRLRAGQPEEGPKLVIGLGTGVNAAPVYAAGAGHFVPPAEAGHIHLPLHGAEDYRLADWLTKRRGFASVEDVLSGSGLERLYAFHAQEAHSGTALNAEQIMAAMEAGDALAHATGRHYVRLLAQVTADLALITLPAGGVYFIGGVARAFAPWLERFGFESAFTDMGRFSDLVARFPVAIVEDDYAALSGCAAYVQAH